MMNDDYGNLVISRRPGESIVIADGEVRITFLGMNGAQARISVRAPRDIKILREELVTERGEL